jgi:type III secretory pathway component EscU
MTSILRAVLSQDLKGKILLINEPKFVREVDDERKFTGEAIFNAFEHPFEQVTTIVTMILVMPVIPILATPVLVTIIIIITKLGRLSSTPSSTPLSRSEQS